MLLDDPGMSFSLFFLPFLAGRGWDVFVVAVSFVGGGGGKQFSQKQRYEPTKEKK
jgi:hypothetical protein